MVRLHLSFLPNDGSTHLRGRAGDGWVPRHPGIRLIPNRHRGRRTTCSSSDTGSADFNFNQQLLIATRSVEKSAARPSRPLLGQALECKHVSSRLGQPSLRRVRLLSKLAYLFQYRCHCFSSHENLLHAACRRVEGLERYRQLLSQDENSIDVFEAALLVAKHAHPLLVTRLPAYPLNDLLASCQNPRIWASMALLAVFRDFKVAPPLMNCHSSTSVS